MPETTGGLRHTWSDYSDAGGTAGPSIAGNDTVGVTCRVTGFAVSDGDTWWYQIATSPWNNTYYASADAFYNNGQTSGTLKNTPFYDPNVPVCGASQPPTTTTTSSPTPAPTATGVAETTGGLTHTWTNYTDACGNARQSIPANTTVDVTCRVTGFQVADGDTWWYEIDTAPWDDLYFASADAFYNNGQTNGSLVDTPLVDAGVPICPTATTPPAPVPTSPPATLTRSTSLAPAPRHEHVHAVIVISWHWQGRYTHLRSISLVQPPRTATVTVSCRGHGCPRGTLIAKPGHLSALSWLKGRVFDAKDRILITVTVPGLIAERAEVDIRQNRKPSARLL
jgi:hypothetical protein